MNTASQIRFLLGEWSCFGMVLIAEFFGICLYSLSVIPDYFYMNQLSAFLEI